MAEPNLGLSSPTCNVSVTFASGLKVTIPNDQLVTPDINAGSDGVTFFNDTTRVLRMAADGIKLTVLGMPFFNAAYLMVNYATTPESFTVWQSNPTPDQDVTALSTNGTPSVAANADATSSRSAMPTLFVSTKQSTQNSFFLYCRHCRYGDWHSCPHLICHSSDLVYTALAPKAGGRRWTDFSWRHRDHRG